jgi:hypothetical protein
MTPPKPGHLRWVNNIRWKDVVNSAVLNVGAQDVEAIVAHIQSVLRAPESQIRHHVMTKLDLFQDILVADIDAAVAAVHEHVGDPVPLGIMRLLLHT